MKAELIDETNERHFSYELEASLTKAERQADMKLRAMGTDLSNSETLDRTIQNYFEQMDTMESSQLFKALNAMPKGAIHHIHKTAANPIDAYLKFTYDDRVYYNQKATLQGISETRKCPRWVCIMHKTPIILQIKRRIDPLFVK